ncbi:MAG: hypothetical protein JNK67_24795 [Alphaproteobacteria bacterium]|nr:hypothetical protein [Alphaproteobacteria bacterium]
MRAVVAGFLDRTLPRPAWTHQAHLAVGLWHVREFGEVAARARLRDGIRAYNEAVGTPNSDTRGYHETATRFYVWAAARHLERAGAAPLLDLVNGFVADPLGAKSSLFVFWSKQRLMSVEARRDWLAPDLAPLAVHVLHPR